jgi:hypothetical protein
MIELPPLPLQFDHIHTLESTGYTEAEMRAYGEACARAAIRPVWLAAGGFEHSVPDDWAPVLRLVHELEMVAATVPNPLGALTAPSSPSSSQTRS